IATVGMSVPAFWLGILAIIVFAVQLRWLPTSGIYTIGEGFSLGDRLRHLAMPAGVLAFTLMPNVIRVARSALLEVHTSDFVRTARAKGLSERVVLVKHTLKNALVPVIAIIGLITTTLFSGSVVVESVFGWAGLGRLAIEAANGRDYPVILGVTMLAGSLVVLVNLLVDVLYALVDPRISHG
ncbi:MAG TPA: ABC transporter permease, partial [Deinococcales bacterium]|nr:ABC transporter permease [Deinococcales bacterium]